MSGHLRRAGPVVACVVSLCTVAADILGAQAARWIYADAGRPGHVLPPRRRDAALEFDAIRRQVVLFGGGRGGAATTVLGDTWIFDGNYWSFVAAGGPPGRSGPAAGFDRERGELILFGGFVPVGSDWSEVADTWSWNASGWVERSPRTVPPARGGARIAFDTIRDRLVLHGGERRSQPTWFDDTWEWDGVDWTRITTSVSPPARGGHAMGYDPVRRRVVVFGGAAGPVNFDDTWEYDGTSWSRVSVRSSPSARTGARMAYSPVLHGLVMYGGVNGCTQLGDVWVFDGVEWHALPTDSGPLPRDSGGWIHYPPTGDLFLFGGRILTCPWPETNQDTWWLRITTGASYTAYRRSCPSSVGMPVLSATAPRAGLPWNLWVTGLPRHRNGYLIFGLRDDRLGPGLLPLDLTYLGAPGCFLNVDSDPRSGATVWQVPSNAAGVAEVRDYVVPSAPAVLGATLYNQYVCIDPASGRPLGITTTNAGRGVVGL